MLMPFNAPLKKSTPSASRRPSSPTSFHAGSVAPQPQQPQPQRNISDFSNASTCSTSTSASETSSLEAAPMRPAAGLLGGAGVAARTYGYGYGYGYRYGNGSRPVEGYTESPGNSDHPGMLGTQSTSTPAAESPQLQQEDPTASSSKSNTFVQQRLSGYDLASPTAQSFGFSQSQQSQQQSHTGSRESSTSRSPVTPRAARYFQNSPAPATAPGGGTTSYHTATHPFPHLHPHSHLPHTGSSSATSSGINLALAIADPEAQHLLGIGGGDIPRPESGPDLAELRRRARAGRGVAGGGAIGGGGREQQQEQRQQDEDDEDDEDIMHRESTPRVTDLGNRKNMNDAEMQGTAGGGRVPSPRQRANSPRVASGSSRDREKDMPPPPPPPPTGHGANASTGTGQGQGQAGEGKQGGEAGQVGGGATRLEARKAVGLQDFLFGEVIGRGSYSTVRL
ncbi:hypothetical protein QFC22_004481 [Naganishia vaughanmartiniae]|uniref:Uncharacterized protein n=1 Tax=Naganishia vaughanmartiniae TaxID=1424756 RepID=A0ACC2X2L0_9TREE|nr:hypothetical protein QFC22_004481 [Naganishia vaughanmartiniae]